MTRYFSAPGGDTAFSCVGPAVSLVSAVPSDGYQLFEGSDGPDQAQVWYQGAAQTDGVAATCVDGQPQAATSIGPAGTSYRSPGTATSTTTASGR